MEQNNDLIKEIRETYAKEEGYTSFASMASNVNIVPRDISVIAKRYAEVVNKELQTKYDNILATESGHESKTENVWQSGYAAGHEAATDKHKAEFERIQKTAIHYANRKDEIEKERDALRAKADRMEQDNERLNAEHADLNLALAAMLNGYQNLSMDQRDWFTVPKDLIDAYTKMVLEYDTPTVKAIEGESNTLAPVDDKKGLEWLHNGHIEFCYRHPDGRVEVRYRRIEGTPECNAMIREVEALIEKAKPDISPYFHRKEGEKEPVIPIAVYRQQGSVTETQQITQPQNTQVGSVIWLTGQYERLYDQLRAQPERKIVCWIDYKWHHDHTTNPPFRDICAIRGRTMEFVSRGHGYGGAYDKAEFLEECERLRVQWLNEGTPVPSRPTCQLSTGCIDWATCEKNNGCKGKEVETKKAKAWDEWRDSLVKHDNVLVHFKERPEKYTEAFTFEEFKIVMLNKSPVFFFNTMYSNDTPLYQITSQFMPSGVDYFATSWADKTPKRKTLEQFYKMLKLDGLENIRF